MSAIANKLIEMDEEMDESGKMDLIRSLIGWMSSLECEEFAEMNGYIEEEDDEDEGENE